VSGHAIVAPESRLPWSNTLPDDLVGVLCRLVDQMRPVEVEVCGQCGSLEHADSPCAVCRIRRTS
jgi:hypothetical protein